MRIGIWWVIAWQEVVISYELFRKNYQSHLKGSGCPKKVGKKLPLLAA